MQSSRHLFKKPLLLNALLLFFLPYAPSLKARTILGELEILRALHLAQPHTDHPHRFAIAPVARHTLLHINKSSYDGFYRGSLIDYKYVFPYGHIEVVSAIAADRVKYHNAGKQFQRSAVGLDDIGITVSYDIGQERNYLHVGALAVIPTASPNPLGTLIGGGLWFAGADLTTAFELPGIFKRWDLSFFGQGALLQSFPATVLLNKHMQLISSKSHQKPAFKETFDDGTGFFNLVVLRSGPEERGFEIGYHGTIIFNVHRKITRLSKHNHTKKSSFDNHTDMEKLTINKNGTKATYVHHIIAQCNTVCLTDWYPIGIVFGGAYAFGTNSRSEFELWSALSLHF